MMDVAAVDKALKELYLGAVREEIRVGSDPLSSRIMQDTTHIVGATDIVREFAVGVSGGVGAGTESGALPTAGKTAYEKIFTDTKNLFGTIKLTDKVIKAVKGPNAGSFINVLSREVESMTKTAKWNLGRQLYGDGTGKLMVAKANGTTSTVIEAVSTDSVRFMLAGLRVDLHKAADNTVYSGMNGLTVLDVDHVNNKIKLDKTTTITAGDYFTVQGSYGLELTGMGKIFETLSGAETIYGVSRASYAWLRPYMDANFGAIDEVELQKVIDIQTDHWNIDINYLGMGNDAYYHYFDLLNQRRAINDEMVLEGGFRALKFGSRPVLRSNRLLAGECLILDTTLFSLDQIDDWDWIPGVKGGILNQVPGYPIFQGSIAKYCDLTCVNPGGLARLTGITAASP